MRKVKLSNCGDYILSPKISSNDLTCENYITTDNMLPNKAGIINAENVPQNISVTQYLKNDILLSNIRPYFKKIWLAEYNGGCSADVLVFRTNNDYDSTYIKYCLSQDLFFAYDMAGSKGSKMPRGDKNHILNFELLDYDLQTQKNIGNLLLSIDNKIELNNKINSKLESLAKTLYDYWFVQFDFPDEFGRPYKSSGGAMVYNDILKREIPIDWEVKQIGDTLEEQSKSTIQVKMVENLGEYPFFTSGNEVLKHNEYFVDGMYCYLSTGGNASVKYYYGKASYSTDTWCISAGNYSFYLYNYLNSIKSQMDKLYFAGTGLQHLQKDILKNSYIVIPPKNYIEQYNKLVSNGYEKCSKYYLENQQLTQLRDFLLPMLMNGQVTIQQ